jgi:hypothetical protein
MKAAASARGSRIPNTTARQNHLREARYSVTVKGATRPGRSVWHCRARGLSRGLRGRSGRGYNPSWCRWVPKVHLRGNLRGLSGQLWMAFPFLLTPLDGSFRWPDVDGGEGLEGLLGRRLGRHPGRYAAGISGSILIGLMRASRLRFWAVAARRNSSLAPFGPLKRRRARRRIRLRCAIASRLSSDGDSWPRSPLWLRSTIPRASVDRGQHDKRSCVAAFRLSPRQRKHNPSDQLRVHPRTDRNGIA